MKQVLLSEIKPIPGTCFKCGSTRNVIKHHLSYNPEVIVDCCRKCHKLIHNRIRKEGACPLSVEETNRLSTNSSFIRNHKQKNFYKTMMSNVALKQTIDCNLKTGHISVSSCFVARNNKSIYYLKE